jgi:hypothetical protein
VRPAVLAALAALEDAESELHHGTRFDPNHHSTRALPAH